MARAGGRNELWLEIAVGKSVATTEECQAADDERPPLFVLGVSDVLSSVPWHVYRTVRETEREQLIGNCVPPNKEGTGPTTAKPRFLNIWTHDVRKYHTQLDYDTVSFTVMPDRSWEQIVSQFPLHSPFVSFDQISLENPLGSADLEVRRANGV